MGHYCPECRCKCHCGGDVDDLVFDTSTFCACCEEDDFEREVIVSDNPRLFIFSFEYEDEEKIFEADNMKDAYVLAYNHFGPDVNNMFCREIKS